MLQLAQRAQELQALLAPRFWPRAQRRSYQVLRQVQYRALSSFLLPCMGLSEMISVSYADSLSSF